MESGLNGLDRSEGRKIFTEFLNSSFENYTALLEKFDRLTAIYSEIASVVNISALKTTDDIYIKHYLDSIYPYNHFYGRVCDVGCGGGFPSIPLAIVTGLNITGIDGVGKKLALIKRCASELKLYNLSCIHSRSEDIAKLDNKFDTVCARALADTDKALSFCAPLADVGGRIILYKTQNDIPAKSNIEKKYGISLSDSIDYNLPGTDIKRRLFIYKK